MSQPQEQSLTSIVVTTPIYLVRYLLGMAVGILTDPTTTSLAIGSFFLGYATTPWAGLAAFFLIHTFIRIVNAVNGAQVRLGSLVGNAIVRHAGVFAQQSSGPGGGRPPHPVGDEVT
jgi:hypothetical protein